MFPPFLQCDPERNVSRLRLDFKNLQDNSGQKTTKTKTNQYTPCYIFTNRFRLVSWGSGKPTTESGKLEVDDFTLDLSNGAQWIATTIDAVDDQEDGRVYNALNNLTLNDGVITLSEADTKVQVDNMTGTGGTLNVAAATTDDGITTASIQIDKAAADASLNVNLTGVTADDVGTVEELEKIVDGAVTGEGRVRQTRSVGEGDIIGKITQTVDAEGKTVSSYVAKNTKLDAFEGVNASTLMAWRNEINHLTKRLGDIRDEASSMGAWARVYGGESTYSDAVNVEVDQTTVQVGLDGRLGDWIVGGAFSYSNGDADITNGEADSDGYTFAVYGTRFFESGAYVDAIARVGRLSTDVTAGDMKGSYDNNAFSLSAELGHNFKFLERAFVEPQFELTYGYVTGDDFSPKAGVKIEQDDFQMLIARLGARTGWEFERNAGRLYAQASVNHDFLGDADGEASEGKYVGQYFGYFKHCGRGLLFGGSRPLPYVLLRIRHREEQRVCKWCPVILSRGWIGGRGYGNCFPHGGLVRPAWAQRGVFRTGE